MDAYLAVRRAVMVEGISRREAARRFGKDPRTIKKMCSFSVPPGYRRSKRAVRPKLDPFIPIIRQILADDLRRRRSSGIRRSGFSSVYATSTAMPAATRW